MDDQNEGAAACANLDESVIKRAQEIGIKNVDEKFIHEFFNQSIPHKYRNEEQWVFLSKYTLMLESSKGSVRVNKNRFKTKTKRQHGIEKLPKCSVPYAVCKKLHKMWKQYMLDVLNLEKCNDPQSLDQKLLKADYHGCFIVVTKSKNYSLIGKKGVIILDRRNSFSIVTPEGKNIIIPKENSVFTFKINEYLFSIWGDNFRQQPEQRIKGKFKMLTTVALS